MSVKWEKVGTNKVKLEIEASAEVVNRGLDIAFKKVAKDVNVPGFRKGKVPRAIFEQRFGVEALFNDALDQILPEVYEDAIAEAGIEPVGRPDIEIEEMGKDKPLRLNITVDVKPEVVLGEYKGMELKVERKFEVLDDEIEMEVDMYRERSAQLEVIEDGEVEFGDFTKIDFEGFKDGVPFEGGKGEDYPLEIGSGSFIHGFEKQMEGMKVGEEKEIDVTFPEEYHAAELAGAPVTFKVKVNEIKRKNIPEADDELAKDVSEFETLKELEQDIAEKLKEKKAREEQEYKRELAVMKAVENSPVDIPESMIDTEVKNMVEDFSRRLQQQGMNMDLYMQYTGQSMEEFEAQCKGDADKRVRSQLILEAVVKAENIQVEETDVEAEIAAISEMYKRQPDEVKAMLEAQGNMDAVRNELSMRKAVDFLVEKSTYIEE